MPCSCSSTDQHGKPAHEGEVPFKRGTGIPLMRVLFTLYHDYRRTNQNCKMRQWCLWRLLCPFSTSMFAPIYRNFYLCVGFFFVQTLRCWAARESLCANEPVPCTAAKTVAGTKHASFVWPTKLASLVPATVLAAVHGTDPLAHRLTRAAQHYQSVWTTKKTKKSNAQIEISINWCLAAMERGHMNLHRHRFLQFWFVL